MDSRTPVPAGTTARPLVGALARGYGLFACALLGAIAWAVVIAEGHFYWRNWQVQGELFNPAQISILAGLGMALSGLVLIAHRNPRSLGWLLLSGGTGRVLTGAVQAVASALGTTNYAALAASLAMTAASVTAYYLALYAVPFYLPAGRLTSRGAAAGVAVLAVLSTVLAVRDTVLGGDWYTITAPSGIQDAVNRLDLMCHPVLNRALAVIAGAGLIMMAVRWRRSATRDTPSAPLLVPYLLFLGTCLSRSWLYGFPLPWWCTHVIGCAVAAIWPIVLGYAAVRDRSHHLDPSARRVLSGFLLATAVIGGYLAFNALLHRVLPSSPAAVQPSPPAAVRPTLPVTVLPSSPAPWPMVFLTAGLALGALLELTTRWSARVVDLYYYGERAKPYQSVRNLSEQLSRTADPAMATRAVCTTAVHVLGLPGARLVAPAAGGGLRDLATAGTCALNSPGCFPLSYHGTVIAHLIVAFRHGEQALDRQDTEALEILAAHAAPAAAAVRLYEDQQDSHQQLLLAREGERLRLRHELHDGLGPALSGLRLQVDLVRTSCPDQLAVILQDASADLGQAVDELRRITDGLAPGALDRHDLATALRQLAGRLSGPELRIDVELSPQPLPPLPADLEPALYRITAEALNNAARHAHASQVRLCVDVTPEGVDLTVRDNGRGLPPGAHTGIGLRSMTLRATELGGTLTITSPAGQGTTVHAQFPPSQPIPDDPAAHGIERQSTSTRVARNAQG
jgi:signal transduction histidine kinase